jgi:hypothetical protein
VRQVKGANGAYLAIALGLATPRPGPGRTARSYDPRRAARSHDPQPAKPRPAACEAEDPPPQAKNRCARAENRCPQARNRTARQPRPAARQATVRCGRLGGVGLFTLNEAVDLLRVLRPVLDELVAVRADAAELTASVARGGPHSSLGGLPELKAAQARLDELLTQVQQSGVEIKGFAPLLLDFPSDLEGQPVLLCWLEGESALRWYHRRELGFPGRRPLP